MAAICQSLKVTGRDKLADSNRISNKALGLSGANRQGNKIAITDSQYQEISKGILSRSSTYGYD